MILYCGVTREEIKEEGICVDLMIDGGTSDVPLNIYLVETWKHLLKTYKDVDYIFIDGGIYGSFANLESKNEILNIIQIFCKKALIIYGDHILKRFYTIGVRKGKDLLQRNDNIPFTYIPVRQYTMENFKTAYNKSYLLTRMQKLRVITEYNAKF